MDRVWKGIFASFFHLEREIFQLAQEVGSLVRYLELKGEWGLFDAI